MNSPQFTGAVLAGGQSRRMGTDKAFLEVGGRWLIASALDALAGASQLLIVGGADPRLDDAAAAADADLIADRWPGQGPLGAVATVLAQAHCPVTVILPCDLPGILPHDVSTLVREVSQAPPDAAPVAAVFTDDRRHFLPLAIHTGAAALAERLFESGQRSMASLLDQVTVVDVAAPLSAVADIDRPEDLA